ncbi:MAG: amidohydrolase family protein [Balneolaceae bacterium]
MEITETRIFDAHLHIIDKRYPLIFNEGFIPDEFTCEDYLERTKRYNLCGGAVVSGSFQGTDQRFLINALRKLGPGFVGITHLPPDVSEDYLIALDKAGIRGVRINLRRGSCIHVRSLEKMAEKVYDVAGWHTELYVDSGLLAEMSTTLARLPSICIDHLGLSKAGFSTLLKLVEQGAHVKATGFGRIDFDAAEAIRIIYKANPGALIFGTDLPSTRAPRPYEDGDLCRIVNVLGAKKAGDVLYRNALSLYRPEQE